MDKGFVTKVPKILTIGHLPLLQTFPHELNIN